MRTFFLTRKMQPGKEEYIPASPAHSQGPSLDPGSFPAYCDTIAREVQNTLPAFLWQRPSAQHPTQLGRLEGTAAESNATSARFDPGADKLEAANMITST
jgi:hypothetical protein